MQSSGGGRILFDVSTSMLWWGPPAGIVRVESELASWACQNVPGVVFVFFDPGRLAYCEVTRDVRPFLSDEAALDVFGLTNPVHPGKRRTDRVPAGLKTAFLWISRSRRMAIGRLERLRLEAQSPRLVRLADRLQRRLMTDKYREFMVRADDTRRPFFPYDTVVGAPVKFQRGDILVCAGSGWGHTNIERLSDLKALIGFRMVLLCHDLIPLMFPQFYKAADVEVFRNYMNRTLAIADQVVVNSHRVEADCRAYCQRQGIAAGDIIVSSFGYDVGGVSRQSAAELPAGLRPGRFALLVSTIEPRKGHRLMYRVWRRLLAEGVPQASGFRLVFAGRPGWMVDDLLAEIRDDPQVSGLILMIHDADDDALSALYDARSMMRRLSASIRRRTKAMVCRLSRPSRTARPSSLQPAAPCRSLFKASPPASTRPTSRLGTRPRGNGSNLRWRARLTNERSGSDFAIRPGPRLQPAFSAPSCLGCAGYPTLELNCRDAAVGVFE
jgi:glycosyltransferase involved in cell wall biosynthesis